MLRSYRSFTHALPPFFCLIAACSNDTSLPSLGDGGAGGIGAAGVSALEGTGGNAGSTLVAGGTGGVSGGSGALASNGGSMGGVAGSGGGAPVSPQAGASTGGSSGSSSTCPAGALLCDDFEGPAPGMFGSAWTVVVDNTNPDQATHGKVDVSTTRFAHGSHSVHITIPERAAGDPAGGSPALLSETKTFPALQNELWGRMLIFYTPTNQLPGSHWVNVATNGAAPNDAQQLRFGGGGGAKLNANELPSDSTTTSATLLPVNQWTCFEWHVQSGSAASMHFYVDGAELTDIAVQDGKGPGDDTVKWQSVPFARLLVGWQYWNDAYGGQMWLDDVAVGSARMPCPAP